MNVSEASLSNALAGLASGTKAQEIQYQLAVSVLKKTQDQQKQQAAALIKMISQVPSPDGTGRVVDVTA